MQRDIAPDVLRGFALLGILVVNIQFMGLSSDEGARGEWTQGLANGTASWLINALFTGKFYLLFSFLFGYSSWYIIKNNRSNRKRWTKRCIAFVLLGALHFIFLWHGDIIFMYGLFGLLLIPFFFRTDKTLKIWSILIYSLSTLLILAVASMVYIAERYFPEEFSASFEAPEPRLDEVLRSGTFLESVLPRIDLWTYGITTGVFLQGGFAFAAFLFGLRLSRAGFLSSPLDNLRNSKMIKRGLALGLPIQIAAAVVYVRNEQDADPSEAIYLVSLFLIFITAPLLSLAYLGIIRRLVDQRPQLVSWMSPAGRMSLTVYLSQSIITSLIFGNWGLGLFQRVETWSVVLIAFAVWGLLVAFSTFWLKRFRQGPFEWLIQKVTH